MDVSYYGDPEYICGCRGALYWFHERCTGGHSGNIVCLLAKECVHMRLSFMKGPLLKDLAKHMYDLKFNVRIDRIWEHWSVNLSTLYGLNFAMVDRKFSWGGTAQGIIPKYKMNKFKDSIRQGVVYTTERYQILESKRQL